MGRSVLLLWLGVVCVFTVQGQQYDPTDCPITCTCKHPQRMPDYRDDTLEMDVSNGVSITYCTADPYQHMVRLLQKYPTIDGLYIQDSLYHTANRAGDLTRLITAMNSLTSLKVLIMPYNNLTVVPDIIGTLTSLQLLDVSNNQLSVLPDSIGHLKLLQDLNVKNNRLIALPDSIGDLKLLQLLDVGNNSLSQLLNSLGNLTSLVKLWAPSNRLTHSKLYQFYADHNDLRALPDAVGTLSQLKWLYLHNNHLAALPDSMGQLSQLQELDISNKKLTALPSTIGKLPLLVNITAHHNYITAINISSLVSVPQRRVDLSYNKISSLGILPANFMAFVFKVDNNNLSRLPPVFENWPERMYLGHNNWHCYCINRATIQQIEDNKNQVIDYINVTCAEPPILKGKLLNDAKYALCAETKVQIYGIPLAVVSTLLVVILLAIGFVYAKRVWIYKVFIWHPFQRIDAAEAEKEFDVFISYCEADFNYIETILQRLEQLGFKICHHKEHFLGGQTIIWNIHNAIMRSKRTLIFFSPAYMGSGLCMYEFYTAHTMQVDEGWTHLITIKDTEIDVRALDTGLRSFFEHYSYIERDSPQFWDSLLYALPVVRMNAAAAGNVVNVAQNREENAAQDGEENAAQNGDENAGQNGVENAAQNEEGNPAQNGEEFEMDFQMGNDMAVLVNMEFVDDIQE